MSAARVRPAGGARGGRGGGGRVGGGGGRGRPGRNSRLGGSLGPSGLLHLLGAVVNHAEPLVGARCRITLQRGRGVEFLDGGVAHKRFAHAGANWLNFHRLHLIYVIYR